MKAKCIRTLRIPAALLCLAAMAACSDSDEDHDGGSTAATPASTGGTMPAPAGGTATNNPPATTSPATSGQLASTQLVGTWTAPKENPGTGDVQYCFTLQADGSAIYATATTTQISVCGGAPTDGALIGHADGAWALAGLNLILTSPASAWNGTGEVRPLDRRWQALEVTINGRTYRKP